MKLMLTEVDIDPIEMLNKLRAALVRSRDTLRLWLVSDDVGRVLRVKECEHEMALIEREIELLRQQINAERLRTCDGFLPSTDQV